MPQGRYRINRPTVIHQTIDGEVIMINLVTGTYYSLLHSGAEIWERLRRGETVDDIVASLRARYNREANAVELTIGEFVDGLLNEELIVPAEDDYPFDDTVTPAESAESGGEFRPPVLERYEDMQDLILLDPVHEVEEEGWPRAKTQ
jgi:hypothetical protein